ncbi:hypothetical protein C8R44DRAFT_885594 [Mycena epipterygia]|nr:hypothetical protein C8R44DRAFT_885594 [Mycena epipterygia]
MSSTNLITPSNLNSFPRPTVVSNICPACNNASLVAENHRFVVANCPAISIFAQNGLVAVLDSTIPAVWLNHDVRVPIPVNSDSRILLKALDIIHCAELQREIALVVIPPPPPHPPSHCMSSSITPGRNVPASDSDADVVLLDSPPESFAGKRFPLEYTCDMTNGMAILSQVKGTKALLDGFEATFPGIAVKAPTVYKHLQFYSDGIKYDLVSKIADFGRKPAGGWKALIAEVKAAQASAKLTAPRVVDLTYGRAASSSTDALENTILYDDGVSFTTTAQKVSHYRLMANGIEDFSDGEALDVSVFDEHLLGSKFQSHLASISAPGNPAWDSVAIAVKMMPCIDSVHVWIEGARAADCHNLWQSFKSALLAVDMQLPNVDVVAASLLTNVITSECSIAQPWHFGDRLGTKFLGLDGA